MLCSGLSSWRDLGAHVHQYPHFFITLYENLAVPNVPGVQQRWEVYRQAPEETGVAAGVGTTSKSDAKTRGGDCLKIPKTSWLEIEQARFGFLMYLTIEFLHAYLSVTPHVPYLSINKMSWGQKKKKNYTNHLNSRL